MSSPRYIKHVEDTINQIEKYFGYKCVQYGTSIAVSTFAGRYEYKPKLFQYGYMAEFYRFVACYGSRLTNYGLELQRYEINKVKGNDTN